MSKSKKDPLPSFGTLVRVSESPDEDERGCVRIKTVKKSPSKNSQGEDDVQEENGVLFWVNRSGFPIDYKTWDRMWDHVAKIHPDGYDMVKKVRNRNDLPQVPYCVAPLNHPASMPIPDRLDKIQNYMRTLQYNHTGTQFFEIRKNRPISGLLECAKDMIKESLPIKCLEAVILGIYMTNGFLGVERFPLSFKSVFGGNVHRHVVLGIYYAGRYGAIGMSRREELMYKPLVFKSLTELVFDFEKNYNKFMHDVKKVKIGLPVSHDPHSYEFINWKALSLTLNKASRKDLSRDIEQVAKEIRSKAKINKLSAESSYYIHAKSKSWINPQQSPSPRKSVDIPPSTRSSLGQASKIYRSHTSVNPDNTNLKRKSLDAADYQLRI